MGLWKTRAFCASLGRSAIEYDPAKMGCSTLLRDTGKLATTSTKRKVCFSLAAVTVQAGKVEKRIEMPNYAEKRRRLVLENWMIKRRKTRKARAKPDLPPPVSPRYALHQASSMWKSGPRSGKHVPV